MNRKIYGLMVGLLGATLAFGLGACNGDESEDGQREGQRGAQRGAQRSTTEITMQTLAGDWGFDTEEVRSSFRSMMEAELAETSDSAAQEQSRAVMEREMGRLAESMGEARLTLNADGSVSGVSRNRSGEIQNATGSWSLDNRNFSMTIQADDSPEEAVDGRVVDIDSIEINFDDSGDEPVVVLLRRRS